jgi:branched-chain amino acid transport system substrate-binding protein
LGYDAVLLTLRVAKGWKPGQKFPVSTLLDKGGFLGLDGPFRFGANGIGERAMEVRAVGNGTVSVVSGAPSAFKD